MARIEALIPALDAAGKGDISAAVLALQVCKCGGGVWRGGAGR
jgi:hypothetical protein